MRIEKSNAIKTKSICSQIVYNNEDSGMRHLHWNSTPISFNRPGTGNASSIHSTLYILILFYKITMMQMAQWAFFMHFKKKRFNYDFVILLILKTIIYLFPIWIKLKMIKSTTRDQSVIYCRDIRFEWKVIAKSRTRSEWNNFRSMKGFFTTCPSKINQAL